MLIEIRRQGNKNSYVYYYRENGKSRYEIKSNIPEVYTSRPVRKVRGASQKLKEFFDEVDIVQRNGYSIIVGYGPKDKNAIRRSNYEFERLPLEFLEKFDWRPIAKDKKISLDIETSRSGELLCMAIYDGKNVYSYSIDDASQDEIIREAADQITKLDPLIIYIHNAAFDLQMLRNLGEFRISVDGNEPKIGATLGFTKMMRVYGRIVIDTYGFSRNYSFSTKKSLEQICEEYGINYKKKVDDVWRTWEENKELVKEYNIEDAIAHYELGEVILPRVIELANFYQTHPGRICFTSKKKLAIEMLKRRCYERNNFVPRIIEANLKPKYDFVRTNFRRGYFEKVHMLLPEFAEAKEMIKAKESELEILLNFEDAWWLERNFGISKKQLEDYRKMLDSQKIINEAFYYFATESIDGFRSFGICDLISVARGKVVGYEGRVFIRGFGINHYPIYTIETLIELADAFFSGTSINDIINRRKQSEIPEEKRTIIRKLGKDWYWYTEAAERLDWLKEAISERLKKGDKFLKTYSEEEIKKLTFGKWLKPYIDIMLKNASRRKLKQTSLKELLQAQTI